MCERSEPRSEPEKVKWLEPELELARNYRYSRQQLKEIESLIEDHYDELVRAWRHHFGS